MTEFFSTLPPTAPLDIALLALGIYYVLAFIEGTRAVAILIGIAGIFVIYTLAQYLDLHATQWVIDSVLEYSFLVVIVLFQEDVRRALARFGRTRLFRGFSPVSETQILDEIAKVAGALAAQKIGALIALERAIGLRDYVEIGTEVDARVDRDLLYSIFLPHSPLHDGAVIIQGGRIEAAGCVLPLNVDPDLSKQLGTRHRAALGLTAETDAVVVVVSEETGTISVSLEGRLTRDLDAQTLRSHLLELFK